MAFTLGIFALSNLLSIFASNFWLLLVARILPAFFHPVYWSTGLSTAANIVPEKEAPKAVSIVFGGFTIASILGVPFATLMADVFNWQSSFVLYAIINTISLVGLLLFFYFLWQYCSYLGHNHWRFLDFAFRCSSNYLVKRIVFSNLFFNTYS